jgi:hypothetical protein
MCSSKGGVWGGRDCPASKNKCRRSLGVSLSAWARLSSTCTEGWMLRPCSSQMYQDTPILASCATSYRRKPGVRLRRPAGSPTSAGERCARCLRKKSARASRRSFSFIGNPSAFLYPGSQRPMIKKPWSSYHTKSILKECMYVK